MYVPKHFRETRREVLHALIRDHSFGTLVTNLDGHLFATHLPLLLDAERGPYGTLRGHMARANPHWRGFRPDLESLVIFQGPHAYISPSWYATEQSVPTWNYTAVHVYGRPAIIDDPLRVRDLLETTVQHFEANFAEPWTTDRLAEAYLTTLSAGIVAFELPIEHLEGKRKLSQNRSPADIRGTVAGLRARGEPGGVAIAELMSPIEARQ